MSLPKYSPKKPILQSGTYAQNLTRYGKPPDGYRWLKSGERSLSGDICANGFFKEFRPALGTSNLDDNFWPHARKLSEPSAANPSLHDKMIAALQKEIVALDKKVCEMTAETNKLVAEQRQKSEDLKVLLAAAEILNKES